MTKDCAKTKTGLLPLFSNIFAPLSETHLSRGVELSDEVKKVNNKLVVMHIGMSNYRQEIATFIKLMRSEKIRGITWYNAGRGNWDLRGMVEKENEYWGWLKDGMKKRNIAPEQVQVLFVKNSVRKGTSKQEFKELMNKHINRAIKELNPKQIFISSAIYSGYAQSGAPRNEPHAYNEGVAVNEFIQENEPNNTWISWGPYYWADGLNPRGDGLIWECTDFEIDGVHPAIGAETKVANMLYKFLQVSPFTSWFPK